MPGGRRFSIEAVFKGIDKITRPLNKMQNAVGKFSRKMQRGMSKANRAATKVSRTLTKGLKMGFAAATAGAVALGAAISKVVTVGAGFEKTMVSAAVKFAGKIRPGSKAFEELESAAREVGSTTEFSASQSAEALDFLAMAGFGAKQAIGALPGVVDLATVSGLELGRATDIASDTLGAFGLATEDTAQLSLNLARVNDVLARTSTSANTSVEQMFEAFTKAAPVANDLGVSIETVSAMTGKLADAGIKGGDAGTVLKNMLLGVSAATPKAERAFRDLGIKIAETEDGSLDIIKTVGNLNEAFGKLSKLERASKIKDIFGKIPIAGVSVLLGEGAEELKKFDAALQGASGTSKEMAGVMRDTTQGSLDSLTSAVEGSIISIFKLRNEGVRKLVDGLTDWVRANEGLIASKIGEFLTNIIDNFDLIVKRVKQVGAVIGVIYGMVIAVKALTAALTLVNLVMAANPLTLTLMALAAVVALTTAAIIANWDDIVLFFQYLWEFFKEVWNGIVQVFEDAVNSIIESGPISWMLVGVALLMKAWGPITEFFKGLWKDLASIFNTGYEVAIKPLWEKVKTFVEALKLVWGGLKLFFSTLWTNIKNIFMEKINAIKSIFAPLVGLFDKVAGAFGGISSAKDDLIKEQIGGVDFSGAQFDEYPTSEQSEPAPEPRTVGPQERLARTIEEKRESSTAQVTIRDETGRAEVTEGKLGQSVQLQPTGTF